MDDRGLLISLYDGCQYRCTFCVYGYVKEVRPLNDRDSMSPQHWYSVLSSAYARGFRALEIGGRGEPTLSPIFTKVVTMGHTLGYQIELLSNALNDKVIIEVLPLIRRLTINLNAVDEEGLNRIHQPSSGFSFDRCIGLVKNVVRMVREKDLDIKLKINYVITAQSLKGAFSFPQRVNRLFAAELEMRRRIFISYQHAHSYTMVSQCHGFGCEGLKKILLLARLKSRQQYLLEYTNLTEFIRKTEKLLERLSLFPDEREGDVTQCPSYVQYTCEVHKHVLFVDVNGDCYGCYNPFRVANGLPIDKDPFYFGNFLSQSFEDIVCGGAKLKPVIDVSRCYWQHCLLCKAEPR